MNNKLFEEAYAEGLLSPISFRKIKAIQAFPLFSIYWELKVLLYLGVVLLSTGLGILIYKNIDTIGHQAVLLLIGITCIGSFYYCFNKKLPFSTKKVKTPNTVFDYVLLLGCLTFTIFIAYLQFQYNVFGQRYGLATAIPMVMFFAVAYFFDHLGVLSLAITNLAAWLGITVTPMQILSQNDFSSSGLIITGLLLGVLLMAASYLSRQKNIKAHFDFTYANFGMHILFISCLAAMFHFEHLYLIFFILLGLLAIYFYSKSIREKSFYIVVVATLYAYIGQSYVVIDLLSRMNGLDMGTLYLGLFYFILSGIGLIFFLMKTNRKIRLQ
jgi:Predicted membrane protein (DUF2157)